MKLLFTAISILLVPYLAHAQSQLRTTQNQLVIRVNNEIVSDNWNIMPELNPDVMLVECVKKKNRVSFSDGIDSLVFNIKLNQVIDFIVLRNGVDTAHTQLLGVPVNINFSKKYIAAHHGKTTIEIAEVSELVNVIMALHRDAEAEDNMIDTSTPYYEAVKTYFAPFRQHAVFDTIHRHISGIRYIEDQDINVFSNESYGYYYALKMNACAYAFDKKGRIKNNGVVREMAQGWYFFDPMKDVALFEDFARKSNFRQFYEDHSAYYSDLRSIYVQLNPIGEMQAWLDKKFKFSYGAYAIHFSPLIGGAHSTQHFTSGDFSQTFMFICRAELDSSLSLTMNELLESRIVFTEIDHNYVNLVSDQYLADIEHAFSNREFWAKGEIADGYNSAYMVFNEYMTWAVYSLYVHDHFSVEEREAFLPRMESQMQLGRGYTHFKAFNQELLQFYIDNPEAPVTDWYNHMLAWSVNEQG